MKFNCRFFVAVFFVVQILFHSSVTQAQSAFVPLGNDTYQFLDRLEIKSGIMLTDLHSSVKPFRRDDIIKSVHQFDTIYPAIHLTRMDGKNLEFLDNDNSEWIDSDTINSNHPVYYFYRTKADFYSTKSEDFMLKINPVIEFGMGADSFKDGRRFTNTRGVDARGWIAQKVAFYIYIGENQARYTRYVQNYTTKAGAVPGEGYFKNFKGTGVDFLTTRGYIDFTAAKFINITFGRDKNFFGNGYRSLQLSDFSEDYLFLRLKTHIWKLEYTNVFADLTSDFLRGGDRLLPKKFAAFHHLSLNATKFLNIGLFEGVVFHRKDGFEFQYLVPVIFYRGVEQGLGSPDNAFIGGDLKINFLRAFSIYGQLMIDDLNLTALRSGNGYWANKLGTQIGIKYVDAFTVENLDLQFESNWVRPYTYSHYDSVSNYTHYNQPLAHPLGANFNEMIVIARYQPAPNFWMTAKWFDIFIGQDSIIGSGSSAHYTNFGSNIQFLGTENTVNAIYGNKIGQGVNTHLTIGELTLTYRLRHNLFIDAGITYRAAYSPVHRYDEGVVYGYTSVRLNIPQRLHEF
ncbi:MAG: hypothetical protein WCI97_01690 [Bacteroidota bacterium]